MYSKNGILKRFRPHLFSAIALAALLLGLAAPSSPVRADEAIAPGQLPRAGILAAGPDDGPIQSVQIGGPTSGAVGTIYNFTAAVSPPTATVPIAYVWRTSEQPPQTIVSGITSTIAYSWTLPGVKTLTVTATNATGVAASTTFTITISQGPVLIPPSQVQFSFTPIDGGTNNQIWFSTQVDPLSLTVPITYTWETAGQPPLLIVRDTIMGSDWGSNGGWSSQWAWGALEWDTVGQKTITFTAANAAGAIWATHTLTINHSPDLTITGPTTGQIGNPYTFTASVTPTSVTLPINYSWQTTEQNYRTYSGGLSDTAVYTWTTGGTKVIYVWAIGASGWDQEALLFEIPTPPPVLVPTIESAASGDWSSPANWNLNRTPYVTDVVLIHSGHTMTAPNSIDVQSLVNRGVLHGPSSGHLVITASQVLSNSGVIQAGDGAVAVSGAGGANLNYHPACNGTSGTSGANILVSALTTYNNGSILAGNGLNGGRGGDVTWAPSPSTNLWNDTAGIIRAGDGGNGLPAGGGGPGGDIFLTGKPFDNDGLIRAGDGGNGDQCGGDGGSLYIYGENTTNTGTIRAGDGGDTTDDTATAHGGDGGDAEVWGKWFTFSGFLVNLGSINAGNGGNGSPTATTNPQDAGCGGDLTLMAAPNVFLTGGTHAAGVSGTPTANGVECADGDIWIDPHYVSLSGRGTHVSGGNVALYGGDGWTLDLRALDPEAISATGDLTLAVGEGGTIDLRANSRRIAQVEGQVHIYADTLLTDPGVPLFALFGTEVITGPSQVLHHASLVAQDRVHTEPGTSVPLHFTLINSSPVTDTFTTFAADEMGWDLSGVPSQVMVGALDHQEITVYVNVPASAQDGEIDEVTLHAVSQSDATVHLDKPVLLVVTAAEPPARYYIFMPLVLKGWSGN